MKLKDLQAKLAAVDEKIDGLLANYTLTAEQLAEHDSLVAEREKVSASVKAEKGRLAREQERAQLAADVEAAEAAAKKESRKLPESKRITDPDLPNAADVPGLRGEAKLTIPAEYRRYGSIKNFRGVKNGLSADQRAFRFGMWAQATLSRQLPHRYNFRKAIDYVDRNMAAATSKDASGTQYLIPEEFSEDIVDLREQYGVARRLLRTEPMTSDTKTIPRRQGGVTAYFVGEGAAGTTSKKVWDQIRLTAKKLMVLSVTSNEVNEDVVINWGDDLAFEIAYAFSLKEDQCAFLGDGTSTYGGIQGICTKLQDCDGAGTDSFGLVTGSGNAYSELTLADFHKVVGRLPVYARGPNTAWACSSLFYSEVMERLLLASGGTSAAETSMPPGRAPRPMFLGFPVELAQVMPVAEANSQVCATLGDYRLGAAFGDRSMDDVEFSDTATVDGENCWEKDLLAVRGKQRFDINVHDVGSSSESGPIVGLQTAGS